MVIGTYVGLATVGGFAFWCMYAPDGPQVTFAELCGENGHAWVDQIAVEGGKKVPMTVALSVLVTVEMFNALNALGDSSLLHVGPMSNPYLIGAIALSFALHFFIMYVPICASIFGVAPLDLWSWKLIVALSLPIVFVDEIMKIVCCPLFNFFTKILTPFSGWGNNYVAACNLPRGNCVNTNEMLWGAITRG